MSDPEATVRTSLITAGLAAAGNIFVGPVRDEDIIPGDSVFVLLTAGFKAPNAYMATSRASFRPMRLNIAVRGTNGSYTTTRDKADNIWKHVQAQDFTGFLGALNNTGSAQYQGKDKQQRDLFMIYLDIYVKE